MKNLSAHSLANLTVLVLVIALIGTPFPAAATILFGTALEDNRLVRIDTDTNAVTTVATASADSLVFDTSGRIIYTAIFAGQVRRFDPASNSDVLLAGGFNVPADLALEPGGNSVLVSEFAGGKIDRINLTTNAVSVLKSPGGNPEGLAYDNLGRLFANLGFRFGGATGKFVAQLDPVTGNTLSTSPGLNSLDGLAFDSVTGHLFAASLLGNGIYELDPGNLSSVTPHAFGLLPGPDGLTSDGAGNIFIAARNDFHVYQFNIAGNTVAQKTFVFGLDDLAPASGLGARVPGPSPLLLLGSGLAGLGALGWRRHRRT